LEPSRWKGDCLADQRLDLLLGVADHADAREIRATGAPSLAFVLDDAESAEGGR
jgi:hypothetical protein